MRKKTSLTVKPLGVRCGSKWWEVEYCGLGGGTGNEPKDEAQRPQPRQQEVEIKKSATTLNLRPRGKEPEKVSEK